MLEEADAQTAPITMVGASPGAIRLDKTINAVLLTKTEGANVNAFKDILTSLIEWEIKVAAYGQDHRGSAAGVRSWITRRIQ